MCFTRVVLSASNPSLRKGLFGGGKQSKEGRQTIFFTPLNFFSGENPDEEAPSDDFRIPYKVHCHTNWKRDQDAVSWALAPSTRSWIAILAESHVQESYTIFCLHLQSTLSERRSNTSRKTLNPTTRAEGDTKKASDIRSSSSLMEMFLLAQGNLLRSTLEKEMSKDSRRMIGPAQ